MLLMLSNGTNSSDKLRTTKRAWATSPIAQHTPLVARTIGEPTTPQAMVVTRRATTVPQGGDKRRAKNKTNVLRCCLALIDFLLRTDTEGANFAGGNFKYRKLHRNMHAVLFYCNMHIATCNMHIAM